MTKRPKHVAVCCDTCSEWTTVNVKRLSRLKGDTDRRRGVPCALTPGCVGRAREPEQLTLPGISHGPAAEQLNLWEN